MSYRYYYLRDKSRGHNRPDGTPSRGVPLACLYTVVNRNDNTVKYALASVHPRDSFVKAKARQIAQGRLETNPIVLQGVPENGHQITQKVMQDILEKGGVLYEHAEEVTVTDPQTSAAIEDVQGGMEDLKTYFQISDEATLKKFDELEKILVDKVSSNVRHMKKKQVPRRVMKLVKAWMAESVRPKTNQTGA